MVRPVPREHGWAPRLHEHGVLVPGNAVRFEPDGHAMRTAMPHATEDIAVATRAMLIKVGTAAVMAQTLASRATPSAFDALGVWPQDKRFVLPGTQCRSLGAIRIKRDQFALSTSAGTPAKLRANLSVGKWITSLPVSCRAMQAGFANGGVAAALALVGLGERIYIRLGLAREYQGKCFLMVNNVVALP